MGKVMNALAVLVHVPAWHAAPARVAAPSLSCVRVESEPTTFPFHSRDSDMEIEDTGLVQSTMAVASTSRIAVVTNGVFAVIVQLIVWSPQLAGLIPVPGWATHGRIVRGPARPPAWARGWAVIVILWTPCGAAGADAQAGTALAAAMSRPPPAAATAMIAAASALLRRDTDVLL